MPCLGCQSTKAVVNGTCPDCGRPAGWLCDGCAVSNRTGDAFCWGCGRAHSALPQDSLAGERKIVTVMFADVKGSLSLIAGLDPEKADLLLTDALNIMRASVHRYGGIVVRVLGDGIMALFGAPLAVEDHALRGCAAALMLRDDMARFAAARAYATPAIAVRIGLSSGEVVVKSVASDTATNYDANGEPVHLASRMEQAAETSTIRLTEATRRLAEGYYEFLALGASAVKGLAHPVETFELLSARPRRTRLLVAEEAGLNSLVGREAELATLRRIAQRARAGEGQSVAVCGEAGHGKSRLVLEAVGQDSAGWEICDANIRSYGRASYRAILDLIARLFQINDEDDRGTLHAKLAEGLAREGVSDLLDPLAVLHGLAARDPGWELLGAMERRQRLHEAVCTLFVQVSRSRPLALIVEDLHWIDHESEELLSRLALAIGGERILLVLTYRPEYFDPLTARPGHTVINLAALSAAQSRELVAALIEPGANFSALQRLLVERSDGVPLFLEEYIAALVDAGTLIRAGGRYRIAGPIVRGDLPPNLRSLLAARIDRLGAEAKRVLQMAATIGVAASNVLLRRLLDMSAIALQAALDILCNGGFLIPTQGEHSGGHAFRHVLIREAAYAGILIRIRTEMHARIFHTMEELYASRSAENLELLSYHAQQADLLEQAVAYAHRAAAQAVHRRASTAGLRLHERALMILQRWPAGAAREEAELDVYLGLREPLLNMARLGELRGVISAAGRRASSVNDPARLAMYHIFKCHLDGLTGHPEAGLEAGAAALDLARRTGDEALEVRAMFQTGLIRYGVGDFRAAVEQLSRFVSATGATEADQKSTIGQISVSTTALSFIARSEAELGRFERADAALERAWQAVERARDRMSKIYSLIATGQTCLLRGEAASAVSWLEEARSLCASPDTRLMSPVALSLLGIAQVRAGALDAGARMIQQSLDDADEIGFAAQQPFRMTLLAEAHLAMGQPADALTVATSAYDRAVQQKEQAWGAYAQYFMARAMMASEPQETATADSLLQAAVGVAEALGMQPLMALCRAATTAPLEVEP
jgi:class 3 adenylate cyclase/tetratricopeptide (TPR) repeat protein